jgi:hypothetical protein
VEATINGQTKEIERKGTDSEATHHHRCEEHFEMEKLNRLIKELENDIQNEKRITRTMAANYRGRILEVLELLKREKEQLRAACHAQKLQNRKSDKKGARFKFWKRRDVEANLQKRNEVRHQNQAEWCANREQMQITRRNHIKEIYEELLQEKLAPTDSEVAILRLDVTELKKVVEEQDCFINQLEANWCGLEKNFTEKCSEMHRMEATFCDKITSLRKELEKKELLKSQAEATLRSEREAMESKIGEKDTQIEELGRKVQEQREEKCK